MPHRIALPILLIVSLLTACSKEPTTSALWGEKGERWSPEGRLHDFSYAGYHASERPIPNVPVVAHLSDTEAQPNDEIDDAAALQALIDDTVEPGAILIPAGRWRIEGRITVNRSGTVIRGEDGAELYFPKSLSEIDGVDPLTTQEYSNAPGFLIFSREIAATPVAEVTANVARGSRRIPHSAPADAFAPGDWIRLHQTESGDLSLGDHLHAGLNTFGPDTLENPFVFPRVFESPARVVQTEPGALTIDRPLPLDLRLEWSPGIEKIDLENSLTEVGVENLVLRGAGDPKLPHLLEAGFNGIEFIGVINGWIRDITFIDTDAGIKLRNTHHSTVDGLLFRGDKRTPANHTHTGGAVGHHPLWLISHTSYNLVSNFEIRDFTVHDTTVEGGAHLNVFRKGKGPRLNFDHHRNFPWANLFTDLDVGNPERLFASGGRSDRGPYSGRDTTLWNLRAQSGSFPPVPNLDKTQKRISDGHNRIDWPNLVVVGLKGVNAADPSRPDQWVEAGGPSGVTPPDLFEAQLKRRRQTQPPLAR